MFAELAELRHPAVHVRGVDHTERLQWRALLLLVQCLLIDADFDLHAIELLLFLEHAQGCDRDLAPAPLAVLFDKLFRFLHRVYTAFLGTRRQTFQVNGLTTVCSGGGFGVGLRVLMRRVPASYHGEKRLPDAAIYFHQVLVRLRVSHLLIGVLIAMRCAQRARGLLEHYLTLGLQIHD